MLHLLEDVLGWVAVLVGSIVMYFTGRYWIDGILTIGIACYILYRQPSERCCWTSSTEYEYYVWHRPDNRLETKAFSILI